MNFFTKLRENKFFCVMLILECIFLVFLIKDCFREQRISTLEAEEWKTSDEELEVVTDVDGYTGVYVQDAMNVVDKEIMHSKEHMLPPGAYEVTVDYKSITNLENQSKSVVDSAGKLLFNSYKASSDLISSTIRLDDGSNTRTSRLWVRWGKGLEDFQGKLLFNGVGELVVKNVEVKEVVLYRYVRIGGYLCLFLLLNVLYLFFRQNTIWTLNQEQKIKICGLGAIIVFTSMLFFTDALFYGHDLTFHLERIHAMADGFMEGQIPHRIQQNMLNGYGYVNPLFYGELFLSVPAFLYCLYLPLQTCYKIYAILLNIATCLISYHCFKKMSKNWKIGLFGSFLYTASAYRMVDIYVRADVGEYTAMTFLPLVVYGFWKVYTKSEEEKITMTDYLPIVLGLSGILECHILTCYMLTVFIPLFVLLLWRKTFKPRRFLALVKSVILVVLLNVWFVYPLWSSMQMDIKVTQAGTMGRIEKYGITLAQMVGVFHTATGNSIWDGVKGEMPLTTGITLIAGIALFLYISWKREQWQLKENKLYRAGSICCILGLLALYFSSSYCHWDTLAVLTPELDQILGTIQFSWRYLEIATIMLTLLVLFSIGIFRQKMEGEKVKILMISMLALMVLTEGMFLMQYQNESEYKKYYAESELTGFDVGSGMEYILMDTDREELNTNEMKPSDTVLTQDMTREQGSWVFICKNEAEEAGYVDIPVLHYDNYVARDVDTGDIMELETGENNRIRVMVPGSFLGTVEVTYQEPVSWRILEGISVATFVVIIGYMMITKKRNKLQMSKNLESI